MNSFPYCNVDLGEVYKELFPVINGFSWLAQLSLSKMMGFTGASDSITYVQVEMTFTLLYMEMIFLVSMLFIQYTLC